MSPFAEIALFGAVVAAAFAIETTLGFGATLVAVAVGSFILPIDRVLPAFVPVNVALSLVLVIRHRRLLDRRLLLRRVLPLMGLGMPAGMVLFQVGDEGLLTMLFGGFVVVLAVAELFQRRSAEEEPRQSLHPLASAGLLVAGGVVHGAFATGGPMAVYVLGRAGLDKGAFRATLCALWLVLNVVLLGGYAVSGKVTVESGRLTLVLAVSLVVGLFVGELLHERIDADRFRRFVFAGLLVVGVVLVVQGLT